MSDAPLRILQIIDSLAIGGAERMAVNISNELALQGHDVHLCASRSGGPLQAFISPGVTHFVLGRKRALDARATLHLARYVRRNGIQIVHAHSSSFFLASIIRVLTGVRVVWHDHSGGGEMDRRAILRVCSISFSWAFAVNEQLWRWASSELMLSRDRITYLPNFPVLPAASSIPPVLPGQKRARIVCAARLNPQKDQVTLVRAMQAVKVEIPDAVLLLVGFDPDDEYARSVKTLVEEQDLAGSVHFLGARTDVADILAQSAIGVLSSKSEGLPVALLEYGLAGLPVVCTAVGACPSVLGNGSYGCVVPPAQPESLAIAMICLLRDPVARRELGLRFQAHVANSYSASSICRQIVRIYRKVLGDH